MYLSMDLDLHVCKSCVIRVCIVSCSLVTFFPVYNVEKFCYTFRSKFRKDLVLRNSSFVLQKNVFHLDKESSFMIY